MSMDFIYDLKDRLDEQNMEYIVMTIKDGNKQIVVDTFYAVAKKDSKTALCAAMDNLCEKWEKGEKITDGDEISIGRTEGGEWELPDFEEDLDYDEDEEEDENEN